MCTPTSPTRRSQADRSRSRTAAVPVHSRRTRSRRSTHAVALGYAYLETDAHLTADGVLVAFHDLDLSRTCGVDASISEMTSSEVASVTVEGRAGIPRLDELLERFPDAHFNIDAKSDAVVDPLCDLVERLDAHERVCLASFGYRRLRAIRRRFGQRVMTNLAPAEVTRLVSIGPVGAFGADVPVLAQVPTKMGPVTVVTERTLRRAHAAGVPVHVWTINDRPTMERLLDLGVDGIMTDDTELLREVFVARGLWPS